MEAGQLAPALEAGLGPVAVGPADVDRAQLAEHQQHLVEMLGAGVVGVDQQRDVVFHFAVAFAHENESPVGSNLSTAASRNGHSRTRPGPCSCPRKQSMRERNARLSTVVATGGAYRKGQDHEEIWTCRRCRRQHGRDRLRHKPVWLWLQRSILQQPADESRGDRRGGRSARRSRGRSGGSGRQPDRRRGRRRGARRSTRRRDQGTAILPRYPRLLLLRRPVRPAALQLQRQVLGAARKLLTNLLFEQAG